MPYKIDSVDGEVRAWSLTDGGATATRYPSYTPTMYVSAADADRLASLRRDLDRRTDVERTARERWRTGFRRERESVLRVDAASFDRVRTLARTVYERGRPDSFRCFNVDFTPEFRFCLENDLDPTPTRRLTTLELDAAAPALASDDPLAAATIDGEAVDGRPRDLLETVQRRIDEADPDVLLVNAALLVPKLYETAAACDYDLRLGRAPGWRRLAGRSTYESYGRVGHSPARYDVPGRVLIDRSNSFFLDHTNLAGSLDLVSRSHKPLQELSWASIGNVLTAIQVREALDRGVLVPWKAWRPEFFKSASTLHAADRGGFVFAPDVGFHERVHELDFSSLYPNIICTRNVSPETVCCDCHADREDVPGLGYGICDERGYLPDVLQPIVDDRDAIKALLRDDDDNERLAELRGRSDALKWILVSCFGYQGFSNAKFGRIECHEAINAFARKILLDAKERLEAGGWDVVHGIVDSLWVTARSDEPQAPLPELAAEISAAVGVRLEYEAAYRWIAFCPRRDDDAGALNRYFGAVAGSEPDALGGSAGRTDEYKYRGIECRQRSTPPYVASVQRDLVRTLDAERSPEAVCDRLERAIADLRAGRVDAAALSIDARPSKGPDEYARQTHTVAALHRAADAGLDPQPGQNLSYVVVDDDGRAGERVRLDHELDGRYDADYYARRLVRAAESVLSPLGWRRDDVERYRSNRVDAAISAFLD